MARGETLLEEGIVLAVMPASPRDASRARIHLTRGDQCEGCPAGALCRPDGDGRRVMIARDPVGAEPGDRVRVMVTGGAVLRASFLVYGLPLLLLLAGVLIGTRIWPAGTPYADLRSFGVGVALAAAAAPLVARAIRRTGQEDSLCPEIVAIITK